MNETLAKRIADALEWIAVATTMGCTLPKEEVERYLNSIFRNGIAEGTHRAKQQMGDVLESLAKRAEERGPNAHLAICWDENTRFWVAPDSVSSIQPNYITLDARTIRVFKSYICGGG